LIEKYELVFYDNNLLANPHIDNILREIADYRGERGKRLHCESQSGFDLRLLTRERAKLLKAARFRSPRIAWDGGYGTWPKVERAIRMLENAGYRRKDIFIFMIYNCRPLYDEMMRKLDACRRWGVRVIDCRYRPLDRTEDNYSPGAKEQGPHDYYIHEGWTDEQVRGFRRAVRRQNIAIVLDLPHGRYIQGCESRLVS